MSQFVGGEWKPWSKSIMLTLRWILTSYIVAFLVLLGVLLVVALFAAIVGSIYLVLLFSASALIGTTFGAVYRIGITKGASSYRSLRLALAFSCLFPGALAMYAGYATAAWVLYRNQLEAPIPNLFRYLSKPGEVHVLGTQGSYGFSPESMEFCCVVGAIAAFGGAFSTLRTPSTVDIHRPDDSPYLMSYSCEICSWEGEAEPSQPLGEVCCPRCGCLILTDTKTA